MTRPHRPAAAVLTLFASALSIASDGPLAARTAFAGPREARIRWKEAQALDKAPWRERLEAFRAVRRETTVTDSYFAKALVAEAGVLAEGGHLSAAHGARATAAELGPRHEPDRFALALAAARALLADEDPRGARPLLEDVVENGGSSAPQFTAPALELLGRLASDDGDAAALSRLIKRAEDAVPARIDVRLALLDLLGVLALDGGDRKTAERALADERRLYDAARRESPDAERVASREWLKLELPKRLDVR
jgi:hypothetical protein